MKKYISNIAKDIKPSSTLEIDAIYKQMKTAGLDVLGFGVGEPDFATPDNIKLSAINAINNNKTKYTPASGILELKVAICTQAKADLGLDYKPENITVCSGAKHNIFIALMTLIAPGDEVIVPVPYWLSIPEMVKMAGGIPVFINDINKLETSITPKTKLIMINSPSNPSGEIYSAETLQYIANLCIERDLLVISDEIYQKLIYDNKKHISIATINNEMKDRTIIISGVSKSYCMTGFRIGYALAHKDITSAMSAFVSHSTSAPCTISQYAALEALSGNQDSIEYMRLQFEKRRNILAGGINKLKYVSCDMPAGAFYVLMDITNIIGKTIDNVVITSDTIFSKIFLEKYLVATVPCQDFGLNNYIRWSYATSEDDISKALIRLEEFINKLED